MLILASASPRRSELLANAGYAFEILSVPVDEDALPGESAPAMVRRLAGNKARAAQRAAKLDPRFAGKSTLLFLGADTIVTVDGQILGKPRDAADARRMLHLLSGRTHQVMTGVALLADDIEEIAAETTEVTFASLSETEIAEYVGTGDPMDKAGAYAIQGYASRWVPRIRGCYFNVVGLPISLVTALVEGVAAAVTP
jgi:septum formation protein